MANFENLTTTDDGLGIISAGLAGGLVVFLRLGAGDGEIASDIELETLSELRSYRQDMPITKWVDNGRGVLTITGVLKSRDNPGPAYQWRELGVYANVSGGPDTLFAAANAYNEFDSIPDATGPAVVLSVTVKVLIDRMINVTVIVGSSTDIDAVNIGPAIDPVTGKDNPGWFARKEGSDLLFKRAIPVTDGIILSEDEDRVYIEENVQATNIGPLTDPITGFENRGWFAQKNANVLEFKRVVQGTGIVLTEDAETITITGASLFPTGGMIPYGGIAPPIDWLMCDGTIYNIVTYPALGATLGATFGGDGVTTFAVPDCRGRSPIGAGQGGGLTNRALGQMVGVETHLLTLAESPSHTHNDSGHLHPDPGHVHPDPGHVHGDAGHNHPDPGHAHVYVDPGHPHPTPRAASVNDVFLSSNSSWGGDWGTGNLLWTNANTSGGSVSVSGAGLQIGYAAIAAAGANLQAVVTGLQAGYAVLTPAGGGQPHNNMSPSLGVNYIIKT